LAMGTALTAVGLDLFNNANLWCWIAPYPLNCMESFRLEDTNDDEEAELENPNPCLRGDNAFIYRWAFYFGPLWLCILIAMVTMLLVYIRVVDTETAKLQAGRKNKTTTTTSMTTVLQSGPHEAEAVPLSDTATNCSGDEGGGGGGGGGANAITTTTVPTRSSSGSCFRVPTRTEDGSSAGSSGFLKFQQSRHSIKEGFDLYDKEDDDDNDSTLGRLKLAGITRRSLVSKKQQQPQPHGVDGTASRRVSNLNSLWFSMGQDSEVEQEVVQHGGGATAAAAASYDAASTMAHLESQMEENEEDDDDDAEDENDQEVRQQQSQQREHQQDDLTTNNGGGGGGEDGRRCSRRRRRPRPRPPSSSYFNPQTRRSQQVLGQGMVYLIAFYMTHLFSTTNRIIQLVQGKTYFPLLVCHSFFDPLQVRVLFVLGQVFFSFCFHLDSHKFSPPILGCCSLTLSFLSLSNSFFYFVHARTIGRDF
jgi:hypothetical protein